MNFRVCILTAGTGSRLGSATSHINKSLIGVGDRAAITRIVEKFSTSTEFVVAVGHHGNLVKEYLSHAHPHRKFIFVEVDPYEGPGSGPGLSLCLCKEFLQCPFIFISCDTLVDDVIPPPDENWMGHSGEIVLNGQYRSILASDGVVLKILEKGESEQTSFPYIGLAGIFDYQVFWDSMNEDSFEVGDAHGLRSLVPYGIKAKGFKWFDTGNQESLSRSRAHYQVEGSPNILEKEGECIWFTDDRVVKFSIDKGFISDRVKRAQKMCGFVPQVIRSSENMYSYVKANGKVLSETVNPRVFEDFMNHCKEFWSKSEVVDQASFRKLCLKFYRDKTLERLQMFYKLKGDQDKVGYINGVKVEPLSKILEEIDWNWLSDGIPSRFHGDLHFENVIHNDEGGFTFLDWRQNFAGNMEVGDVYYDLAKLHHGMIMSHELVLANQFRVSSCNESASYDFHRKNSLVECERQFESWVVLNGYDWKKVRALTALIFLNIAPLHHDPYNQLLYFLGREMISRLHE
jgi:choline kinase/thiamine kinase-like enzyme